MATTASASAYMANTRSRKVASIAVIVLVPCKIMRMTLCRHALPQIAGGWFLTDGGLETTMIFHEKLELPEFASFVLLKTPAGLAALNNYYRGYADLAVRFRAGLVLEAATWRANADWGRKIGYNPADLVAINRQAIDILVELRDDYAHHSLPFVISGCLGPRGDGYRPDRQMSATESQHYHQAQVDVLAGTETDMISAFTMNYVEEALGIVQAAQQARMPMVISFTVETDGQLATGQSLRSAIEQVDAATAGYPSYYMVNCAHPRHFTPVFAEGGAWLQRIRGLRSNSSTKSHAELNESTELDIGQPIVLASEHQSLVRQFPHINVLGGCCGTDLRHVEAIARACIPES